MAVRVREPVALLDPETGAHVVPRAGQVFADNDPLVKAHRWAFTSDEEALANKREFVESVPIERATANPGERRTTKR